MGLWVKDGAELCGRGADLGTVEVGKLADLVVVGGNPLDDIENLAQLLMTPKEGRIVRRPPLNRRQVVGGQIPTLSP